ncbi:MAG: hypothetical protein Q8P56_03985 [Candidatus Uhrbacteria bacterium]|nr:hypothetical protein [Candidatus Uhrbacteria bacterium]
MKTHPTGEIIISHLPGTASLFKRAWIAYRELFPNLIALTALLGIGAFLNIVIQDGLTSIAQSSPALLQSSVKVINILLNIAITGFYFCFIFAAMIYLVHGWKEGRKMRLDHALKAAAEKYVSLFFVGFVLFLVMNGGLLGVIMPLLFSVWFYFALYVVLLDDERGVAALAKSRYLTHGTFFRVVGRYAVIIALFFFVFSLLRLLLLLPAVGWALFGITFILLVLFGFPFFIVYEYYRYQDLAALKRNLPFTLFAGEKWSIIAWAVLGCIMTFSFWTYDVIGEQGRARFTQTVIVGLADAVLPISKQWNENMERSAGFLEKLRIVEPQTKNDRFGEPTYPNSF